MFQVGQKVVCITHAPTDFRLPGRYYPEKGSVYTVRDIFDWSGVTLIRLAEIKNPLCGLGIEHAFGSEHFRPIQERKTDISIFTDILDKVSRGDLIMVEF